MMVLVVVFMAHYSITAMSLAGSQHRQCPPEVASGGVGVAENWAKINREDIAQSKLDGMGIDTGHDRRCRESVVNLVNMSIQKGRPVEESMKDVEAGFGYECVYREFDQ